MQNAAPSATIARKKTDAARKDMEAGHHLRVVIAATAAIVLLGAIAAYGASYYLLPLDERPYSDKYELLRPSGLIGINLGIFGTFLFFIIFLYALRKVIPWLGRIGTARHWMDFHVIAGVTAPIVIAFHASFKFSGIAGFAFWIMVAVALSGIIGRYLYAQIPHSLNAAVRSLDELQRDEQELAEALHEQSLYSAEQINRVLSIPSADHIRRIGPLLAIGEMIALDLRSARSRWPRCAGLLAASPAFSGQRAGCSPAETAMWNTSSGWSGRRPSSPSGLSFWTRRSASFIFGM